MRQKFVRLMSMVRGSRRKDNPGSHPSTTDSLAMATDLPSMGRGQQRKGSQGSHLSATASQGVASDLPEDLWMYILAKLTAAEDLNACALVCSSWRGMVRSRAVGVEAPARDFFEGSCHGFQAVSQLPELISLRVTAAETISQPQGLETVLKGMEKIGNLGPSLKYLLLGGGGRGQGWNLGGGVEGDRDRDRDRDRDMDMDRGRERANDRDRGRDRDGDRGRETDRERGRDRGRDLTQDLAVHPLPASSEVHPLPSSFGQLAGLEKLLLEELPFLGSLEPVVRMPRLRSLMVVRCPNAELPKELHLMTGLENLTLKGCSHVPESIRFLTGLRSLTICGSNDVSHVPDLSPLVNLQCLNLSHCSALERLPRGLESLPQLECLNIFGSRKLAASDIADLRHARPRLQVLRAWPVTYHIIAIVQRAR